MSHGQVVRAVEHTAISVATAVNHVAVALSSRNEHARTVEFLGDERLRSLRTEVAQEHNQCIAASLLHLVESFQHVLLVLNSGLALVKFAFIGFYNILTSFDR